MIHNNFTIITCFSQKFILVRIQDLVIPRYISISSDFNIIEVCSHKVSNSIIFLTTNFVFASI
ncbi:Uncharacterised protein [Segatella copri]|nr:Uncharacterised protein [Segatella copri]